MKINSLFFIFFLSVFNLIAEDAPYSTSIDDLTDTYKKLYSYVIDANEKGITDIINQYPSFKDYISSENIFLFKYPIEQNNPNIIETLLKSGINPYYCQFQNGNYVTLIQYLIQQNRNDYVGYLFVKHKELFNPSYYKNDIEEISKKYKITDLSSINMRNIYNTSDKFKDEYFYIFKYLLENKYINLYEYYYNTGAPNVGPESIMNDLFVGPFYGYKWFEYLLYDKKYNFNTLQYYRFGVLKDDYIYKLYPYTYTDYRKDWIQGKNTQLFKEDNKSRIYVYSFFDLIKDNVNIIDRRYAIFPYDFYNIYSAKILVLNQNIPDEYNLHYGIIISNGVRVREKPDLASKVIGNLNMNDKVKILESSDNFTKIENEEYNWIHVVINSQKTGWIWSKYINIPTFNIYGKYF